MLHVKISIFDSRNSIWSRVPDSVRRLSPSDSAVPVAPAVGTSCPRQHLLASSVGGSTAAFQASNDPPLPCHRVSFPPQAPLVDVPAKVFPTFGASPLFLPYVAGTDTMGKGNYESEQLERLKNIFIIFEALYFNKQGPVYELRTTFFLEDQANL